MDTGIVTSILMATLMAGTPLAIAALGELVVERSGVLNLGVEGMMAMGAIAAFAAAHHAGSAALGVAAGMAAGVAMAALFAVLALTLQANQVAAGLALTIFGVGLSAFVGKSYEANSLAEVAPLAIPWLSDLPFVGALLFAQKSLVYFSWLATVATGWFLYRSPWGLIVRAVGESPAAAHSVGYPVIRIRYATTLFGGAMAGVAGAFLSVYYTPLWAENMIAGRGWIALALVVFATWRPGRTLAGAYLFGGMTILQLFVQASGVEVSIPSQFLATAPYLATIAVVVLISRNLNTIRLHSPASLGRPYRPDA
jgi:simple sugar transport system permease protein